MKQPWLLLSLALVIVILIAPLLAPYDPMATNPGEALQPPGAGHLLGTDALGRDVLSRVLHGGQRTLYTAALATVVALLPGVGMGMLAAAAGGRIDAALLAVINAWLAFPALLLALVVVTLLGVGLQQVALATGAALIPQVARVARTAAIEVQALPFVSAGRAAGGTGWWVMTRHVLPNAAPAIAAYAGVTFAYAVLNSAALSFLGLAGDLGVPDWGAMLYEARVTFRAAPWVSIAPGLAITCLVYTANRAADRLIETRQW
ncbi:MAG: ABC transporter permease [Chloroflexota bacterium]|nr:MAG: ABC transporter permease [Chloroflexota bacterium]